MTLIYVRPEKIERVCTNVFSTMLLDNASVFHRIFQNNEFDLVLDGDWDCQIESDIINWDTYVAMKAHFIACKTGKVRSIFTGGSR